MSLDGQIMSQEVRDNPFPFYEQIRKAHQNAYWDSLLNCWIVIGHREVSEALRHPSLSSNRVGAMLKMLPPNLQEDLKPLLDSFSNWALFKDGKEHSRIRGLLNKGFSPKIVKSLTSNIQSLVDRLMSPYISQGRIDIIKEVAIPLPIFVIGELLGVPSQDQEKLKKWSTDFSEFLGSPKPQIEAAIKANESVLEMDRYFKEIIQARREDPKEDLISELIKAEEDGKFLDEKELQSTFSMILFGGHETTTNLIGNGTYALLGRPEKWQELKSDPSLLPSTIDELLRFDAPVQFVRRLATENFMLGGHEIKKGQVLVLSLGAANRDPSVFENPDQLILKRAKNPHLSFGHGSHYCIGAVLSKLETEIYFKYLMENFSNFNLEPNQNFERQNMLALRCFKNLICSNQVPQKEAAQEISTSL